MPLLERVKFLAIVSSNIDEFFQKRIGGLKQQVGAQLHSVTPDGRTPQQQIADCLELITRLEARKAQILEQGDRPSCKARRRVARAVQGARRRSSSAWVREYYLATSSRWSRRRRWIRRTRSRSSRTCR